MFFSVRHTKGAMSRPAMTFLQISVVLGPVHHSVMSDLITA